MNALLRTLVILLAAFSSPAFADTTWVNDYHVSGHWTADHSPYMIHLYNLAVAPYDTLIIDPGVRIVFGGPWGLYLENFSYFHVQGMDGDSVVFTTDTLQNPQKWRGIHLQNTYPVSITYAVIENAAPDPNSVLQPALEVFQTSLNLSHSVIRRCGAYSDYAGGLTISEQSSATLTFCRFYGNRGGEGGAVEIEGNANFEDCQFDSNFGANGGGIVIWGGSTACTRCTFQGNHGNYAGAFSGPGQLQDCQFLNNSATFGGAISNGSVNVTRCLFADNHAVEGGATRSPGTYDHCVFVGDSAQTGGAMSMSSGIIRNCTFVGNAAFYGSVIDFWSESSNIFITNSIFALNRRGVCLYGLPSSSYDSHVNHNAFFGNAFGSFHFDQNIGHVLGIVDSVNINGDSCDTYLNLYLDPLFADTVNRDFHLTQFSPCIDACEPGQPHDPDSTVADMGAFYFDQTPDAASHEFIPQPSSFGLSSYPNPFNGTTTISFDLPVAGAVRLTVADLLGREVQSLHSGLMPAGAHHLSWTANDLPSGVYFARLETRFGMKTRKLLLLK